MTLVRDGAATGTQEDDLDEIAEGPCPDVARHWRALAAPQARPLSRILIVEDDAAIVDSLTEALSDEGYDVISARDGVEAMAVLRAGPLPSLIILDWMMPRCDGPCFRRQQQADPILAGVPVVVLTADPCVQQRRSELEAAAYLKKPIGLGELLRVIEANL